MYPEHPVCVDCGRFEDAAYPFQQLDIEGSAELMIVLGSPKEHKEHMLQDSTIVFLREQIFPEVGIKDEQVHFAYATKCCSPTRSKVCATFLHDEIRRVKPRAILCVGNDALIAVAPTRDKVIMAERGTVSDYDKNPEIKVVPCVSLDYMLQYMNAQYAGFMADVRKAHTIALLGTEASPIKTDLKIVKTQADLEQLYGYIKQHEECAFDIETTGLNFFDPAYDILTVSFTFRPGSGFVIVGSHPLRDDAGVQYSVEEGYDWVAKIFQLNHITWYGWNIKFDSKFIRAKVGIESIPGKMYDVMLMQHLIDENLSNNSLKDAVKRILPRYDGYAMGDDVTGLAKIDVLTVAQYNATDTDVTLQLGWHFLAELVYNYPDLYVYFRNLSAPVTRLTEDMEYRGMLIDMRQLKMNIPSIEAKMADLTKRATELPEVVEYEAQKRAEALRMAKEDLERKRQEIQAKKDAKIAEGKKTGVEDRSLGIVQEKMRKLTSGEEVVYEGLNLGSSVQLKDLFYKSPYGFRFPLPYDEKSRGFTDSTSEDLIAQINDDSGFIKMLLEHREAGKILGTYMIGIEMRLSPGVNPRLHTSFMIHGTKTGRLSSRDPNLQNIPRSGEYGSLVKKMFVPPEGYTMMQVDYSQAELRLAAFFSQDPEMSASYARGEDLHTKTAKALVEQAGQKWEELSDTEKKQKRTQAKAANFGLLYGLSANGYRTYAKTQYGVNMTQEEANEQHAAFFRVYKCLLTWHERYRRLARDNGYVETLHKRRRHLPDIYSSENGFRAQAERQAINSPIQGSGGEYTVFSACILSHRLAMRFGEKVQLVNTVHDSLIFYVHNDVVQEAAQLIRETCEYPLTREYWGYDMSSVGGMKVDIEVGPSWKELTPLEVK